MQMLCILTFMFYTFYSCYSDVIIDKKIQIFSTVFTCLPSEEVTQKYLSLKIANITNYEIFLLRPDCCAHMIHYDDTPDSIHVLEFNATYPYHAARGMLTSYNIDLWLSMHQQNCIRVLSDDEIMNKLRNISFDFSIIQTWDLCGTIISDILNLKRIDFQIEAFMYPMLDKMYDFIYYDSDNIIPKSGSDETFQVHLLTPYFNQIRQDFNVSIKTQKESWDSMTRFVWIPSIPGYEYPNYLVPQIQFIGPIRSERNKYLLNSHEIINWLDALSSDKKVIFFSFGTLWHNMEPLKHRDEQIFSVLNEILTNKDSKYDAYYVIFKSIHRHKVEHELLTKYGRTNRFKFYNYTEWIPQTIILDHERVKLLVCHGGYGHVQEAIFHSVPSITIPFEFDQPLNAEKSKRIGVSYQPLNVTDFTSTELVDAIEYVLNNQTFYQKVKAWSNAMKTYDGKSIIKFTMQTIVDGISESFELNVDPDQKLKYIANQSDEQCKS